MNLMLAGCLIYYLVNHFFFGSHELPWEERPSLYSYISRHINRDWKLGEEGMILPDEIFKEDQLIWVPGGMEGTYLHHFRGKKDIKTAKKVARFIKDISEANSLKAKIAIYRILKENNIISYIDDVIEVLIKWKLKARPYLIKYARWLAYESPDRGAVKMGIALLGLIRDQSDLYRLKLLSKHDEFTLYSLVAVGNMLPDSENELWDMAKYVDGWGKIHLVERLSETKDPEIKKWLLTAGFENNVMNEYLAFICAVVGELHIALRSSTVSREVLDAAAKLIKALLKGGPSYNIEDYPYAASVFSSFMDHITETSYEVEYFLTAYDIKEYLEGIILKQKIVPGSGGPHEAASLLSRYLVYLSLPVWPDNVLDGLHEVESSRFKLFREAAGILKLDIWDLKWDRLHCLPDDQFRWYDALSEASEARVDRVLDYAESVLPLNDISSGPDLKLGFGHKYRYYHCLDVIVQALARFPGKGFSFILAGLLSPIIRNRNMAVYTLNQWKKAHWEKLGGRSLKIFYNEEPDNKIKQRIRKLLS